VLLSYCNGNASSGSKGCAEPPFRREDQVYGSRGSSWELGRQRGPQLISRFVPVLHTSLCRPHRAAYVPLLSASSFTALEHPFTSRVHQEQM